MTFKFNGEGHLDLEPKRLLTEAKSNPRRLVNDYLLTGTPRAFKTYKDYRSFVALVSESLQVPPQSIAMRGSCHIGFSIAPRSEKVWREMTPKSDIDIAIVDVDYFGRIDDEVRRWEARQGQSAPSASGLRRRQLRAFNCVDDRKLPQNTCVPHVDAMARIDTTSYCTLRRPVTAWIFRDWWSLRNRYEYDLRELCAGIDAAELLAP